MTRAVTGATHPGTTRASGRVPTANKRSCSHDRRSPRHVRRNRLRPLPHGRPPTPRQPHRRRLAMHRTRCIFNYFRATVGQRRKARPTMTFKPFDPRSAPPPAAPRPRGGDGANDAERRRAEAKASALVSHATFNNVLGHRCHRHNADVGVACWLLLSRDRDHRALCGTRLTSAGYPELPAKPERTAR